MGFSRRNLLGVTCVSMCVDGNKMVESNVLLLLLRCLHFMWVV